MSRTGYPRRTTGFTLVELIVVVIIIVVLVAIFVPFTHRGSREATRRMQCGNNVKQMCLGLQTYHDTFLFLPYGARNRTLGPDYDGPATWGSSWFLAITPQCESTPLYDRTYAADIGGSDYASSATRTPAHNAKIKYMLCPSSPLPEMENLAGQQLVVPTYAGIMGANELLGGKIDVVDPKGRIVAGPYGGWAAGNGLLPLNESLPFDRCSDGTANTIIVGEVSDWYYNDAGKRFNPALAVSDAGDGPHVSAAGWLAGTDLDFKIERDGQAIPADRVCNLITLEHAVGINNRNGVKDPHPNWGTQGIGRCGLNNPLLAAHPAGAMVGYLDGHVQLLTKQTDPFIIKRLAIRDDGGVLPDF